MPLHSTVPCGRLVTFAGLGLLFSGPPGLFSLCARIYSPKMAEPLTQNQGPRCILSQCTGRSKESSVCYGSYPRVISPGNN